MFYRRVFDFPTWSVRKPYDELDRMRRQMDRLYDTLVSGGRPVARSGVFPLMNLTEDKDNYYIRAELPGMSADQLDLQVTANNLSVTGERQIIQEEGVKYHRRERESGKFSRMISLPGQVDAESVKARLLDGVLTVVVPKAEAAKPKQITVN